MESRVIRYCVRDVVIKHSHVRIEPILAHFLDAAAFPHYHRRTANAVSSNVIKR